MYTYRCLLLVASLCCVGFLATPAAGQSTQPIDTLTTHLPIVVIDTEGQEIPDDPKLMGRMGVIDNGPGAVNRLSDPYNGYDGFIGIERRGSSSQSFPKLSYGFETWDEAQEGIDVAWLGFPKEEDWILYGPYSDKSLLRNVLIFHLSNQMGRYGSRTRFIELTLNGSYQGVYVAMEKIKRDGNRVDIAKLDPDEIEGDDLTGGYIVKIDKWTGSDNGGWASPYPPRPGQDHVVYYQYDEPKATDIVPEQQAYIQQVIAGFEDAMAGPDYADPVTGYAAHIDVDAAADFFILNEIGRNVDGYRLSTFLYKDKDSNGGKLTFGPGWDFNLAFGNADYYNGGLETGFQAQTLIPDFDGAQPPFWWEKLWEEPAMNARIRGRWDSLRTTTLHTDSLLQFIDAQVALLGVAADRNFQRWPVLGSYVWPNRFVGATYAEEVNYLKEWVETRMAWIDDNLPAVTTLPVETLPENTVSLSAPYPNPFTESARMTLTLGSVRDVQAVAYDMLGRRVAALYEGLILANSPVELTLSGAALAGGIYMVEVSGPRMAPVRRLVAHR